MDGCLAIARKRYAPSTPERSTTIPYPTDMSGKKHMSHRSESATSKDSLLAVSTAWVQGLWARLSGGLMEDRDADDGAHK